MGNNSLQDLLRKETKPIYQEMLSGLCEAGYNVDPDNGDYAWFKTIVGENYSKAPIRVVFYGRATNSWDGWEDVNDGLNAFNTYKKSAFFRAVRSITSSLFGGDKLENICWSNVCKISPWNGGNPSDRLYEDQKKYAAKIMKAEIECLHPDIMIFITGITPGKRWDEMLDDITINYEFLETCNCAENEECSVESYRYHYSKVDNPLVLITGRPEFKSTECLNFQRENILRLIKKFYCI